jgi:hypothetical protein
LRCVALRCVALRCVALRCVALRCVALRCVASRCFVWIVRACVRACVRANDRYLAFPPLANLTNAVLMSLNDLRHAALRSLKLPLARAFQRLVLNATAAAVAKLPGTTAAATAWVTTTATATAAVASAFQRDGRLRDHHRLLCLALFRHAIPYFASCFLAVFGQDAPAAAPVPANQGARSESTREQSRGTRRHALLPPLFSIRECALAFRAAAVTSSPVVVTTTKSGPAAAAAAVQEWLDSLVAVAENAAASEEEHGEDEANAVHGSSHIDANAAPTADQAGRVVARDREGGEAAALGGDGDSEAAKGGGW